MSEAFRPPNLALATISLSLATFMQVLDTTIANVSLPTIAGNLGVSANQSTWVITSFAVSNAIALPLTGFMTRRFGETRLFVWSTLLFSLASFLCGTAQTMSMLILFRALQGAVAGPMYPITQSLLISIYPPHKRGMALALFAMVTVVAPIAGPILGGWITDDYTWPWIFFINVPIGIFASLTVAAQMKGRAETTSRPKVDYVGLVTLVVGVGTLQIVLDKGNDEDWFNSTFIVSMAVVSAIAIAVFLIWELTDDEPIVNLKLFRHRNFSMGTLALVLGYAAFFAINVLVPQWLQRNLGYTATWAGFATAPLGVLPVILTPFVGRYAPRFDLRVLAGFAFLMLGATCLMRSYFYIGIDFRHIALIQLLQGLGVAFFFAPVLTILLSDLAPHEIADGAGLATFLRTLGASFAASLTNFLWDHRAIIHHERLGEHVTIYDPATSTALRDLGGQQDAVAMINQTLTQQAYQLSFNEVFHLLGWIFLTLIAVVWLAKPPFEPKAGMTGGGH
ncbi:DHA2 family efflux MFS transporter permease subunit [Dyella silvae]|uniref:DHA2 family efflux MFS transporter permease subunit n=1 Tax=Dyella silvae TaxID=2994424 RepID=UPI0022644B07|nr:DHA2 family efflux MFS transporter permease subunit [Dyella silvae]